MQHQHRPLLALGLRIASAVALATMFMLSKLLGERGVAVPEMMFWRQAASLPVIALWLGTARQLGQLRTDRLGGHLTRASLGTIGMALNLAGFQLLHLSEATTLSFTTPMFAVVLTAVFLPEKVGPWRWVAVAVGFAGVLLITQPGAVVLAPLGIAVGLAAAAFNSVISFQIRELARTEPPVTVVFWFAVFGTLFVAPALPFCYHPHDRAVWAMLLALGLIGTLGQWLLTSALRYGPVASVVVMDYTQLLWATLYGWLIWGEFPHETIWLGAPLIVASGLTIAFAGHRRAAMPAEAAE